MIPGDIDQALAYAEREALTKAPETVALLKILELGNRQIEDGKTTPAAAVIKRLAFRSLPSRPA